jgi:hypothetical protein
MGGQGKVVAYGGKSLKGSYDTANNMKISQLLRAFAVGTQIILKPLFSTIAMTSRRSRTRPRRRRRIMSWSA